MEAKDLIKKAMILADVLLDIDYKNQRLISSYEPSFEVSFQGLKDHVQLRLDSTRQSISIDQRPESAKATTISLPAGFIKNLRIDPSNIEMLHFADETHRPFLTTPEMRERLNGALPVLQFGSVDYQVILRDEVLFYPMDERGATLSFKDFEREDMGDEPATFHAYYDALSRGLVDPITEKDSLSPEIYRISLPNRISLDPVGYAEYHEATWSHLFLISQGYTSPRQVAEKMTAEELSAMLTNTSSKVQAHKATKELKAETTTKRKGRRR